MVEFQCHGGIAIANMIVDEVLKMVQDLQILVSFQKDFFNNKIDLSKAEAISKIIEARSEDAVKLLARQLKGELTNFVNDIRERFTFYVGFIQKFQLIMQKRTYPLIFLNKLKIKCQK